MKIETAVRSGRRTRVRIQSNASSSFSRDSRSTNPATSTAIVITIGCVSALWITSMLAAPDSAMARIPIARIYTSRLRSIHRIATGPIRSSSITKIAAVRFIALVHLPVFQLEVCCLNSPTLVRSRTDEIDKIESISRATVAIDRWMRAIHGDARCDGDLDRLARDRALDARRSDSAQSRDH